MKTPLAALFLLLAVGAVGMGFVSAPASAQSARLVAAVVMRPVPTPGAAAVAKPAPVKADAEVKAVPKPAEAPVEAAPVAPAAAVPVAAPAAVVPAPVPEKPAIVDAAVARPAPVVAPAAAPVAAKPAPTAPKSGEGAVKPAAGGSTTDGSLNLRASDTADVYIDGRKVGGSPVLGHRVKAGKHKVRFDCYDGSGEPRPGIVQTVEVAVEGERDVEYECPVE
jgi:cytoskeleton protein RodZ